MLLRIILPILGILLVHFLRNNKMLLSCRFHHIGMAVFDIVATAKCYESAGYLRSITFFDPIQNVDICWLTKAGEPMIELLAPVDDNSPVNGVLAKNGVGPYHCCYEVNNLEEAILELKKMRFILVSKPSPAVAIRNYHVAFLYHKNVGLIELVESPAEISI